MEDLDSIIEIKQGNKKVLPQPMKPFDEIITGPNPAPILQILDDSNFFQPSQIQNQVIHILCNLDENSDLIIQAPSGTGKTTSFIISMLFHVNPGQNNLQTICICKNHDNVQVYKI